MTRNELTQWFNHVRDAQDGIAKAERAILDARRCHGSYEPTLEVRARDVLGCLIGARELLALTMGRIDHLASELEPKP